jgi:adenylate cyclase
VEALADPGGICVSRVVRDQVLDKLSFTFADLGARQVKNIACPVRYTEWIWGVDAASTQPRSLATPDARSSGRRFDR